MNNTYFKQIPIFKEDTQFNISGKELHYILEMVGALPKFQVIFDNMLARFIDEKKVTIRYKDFEDNDLSKQQIEAILKNILQELSNSNFVEPII